MKGRSSTATAPRRTAKAGLESLRTNESISSTTSNGAACIDNRAPGSEQPGLDATADSITMLLLLPLLRVPSPRQRQKEIPLIITRFGPATFDSPRTRY